MQLAAAQLHVPGLADAFVCSAAPPCRIATAEGFKAVNPEVPTDERTGPRRWTAHLRSVIGWFSVSDASAKREVSPRFAEASLTARA